MISAAVPGLLRGAAKRVDKEVGPWTAQPLA